MHMCRFTGSGQPANLPINTALGGFGTMFISMFNVPWIMFHAMVSCDRLAADIQTPIYGALVKSLMEFNCFAELHVGYFLDTLYGCQIQVFTHVI